MTTRKTAAENDRLVLAEEKDEASHAGPPLKVLVVDDDKEVHAVTKLALDDFSFEERPLQLLSAYSGAEARQMLRDNPDIALILLDVVMETDDAGLTVARFVREELGNRFVRIVLRTGQPGLAPERRVLRDFDINDYRTKTELTQGRMFSVVYAALASHRDLLEIARSRQELGKTVTELERSNRELEQFAYVASHDLQAPLRGITGFAQLLERKLHDSLDEDGREYLHHIVASAAQMRQLVEALLNLSRVGSGGAQLGEHALSDILAHARERLSSIIEERGAVLEVGELPVLRCDRTMMVQLMQNLVGNGIKFQPRKPPLVQVSADRRDHAWHISIRDHGIGIKPEHFEGIFKIFHRLHTSEEFEGSGIGLAICEKIVHMHGGRIWVESKVGEGTTFHFSIPDHAPG